VAAAARAALGVAPSRQSLMLLHYLSYARLGSGAANVVHVVKMCDAFTQAGHDVTLFAMSNGRGGHDVESVVANRSWSIEHPPVSLQRIPPAVALTAFVAWKGRNRRPDLYYGRHLPSLVAVDTGHIPIIYESHAPAASRPYRYLESRLFRSQAFLQLVVITEALADEYVRAYGSVLDDKVLVAPDAASPCPDPRPVSQTRSGRPVVGYVGSLYEGRGIELICAMAEVLPGYQFEIAGGNRRDVRAWRQRAGAENIRFLGHIPQRDVCSFMRSCDVLLAPYQPGLEVAGGRKGSERWMSPLKVFEYMASGRPMVCSDFPVLREVLEDGRNALLRHPGRITDWIDAVQTLVEDELLRKRIGDAALKDFAARYTWRTRAEQVLTCTGSAV
jgi:glycosyltransferase involved in cell wall biosynthesis